MVSEVPCSLPGPFIPGFKGSKFSSRIAFTPTSLMRTCHRQVAAFQLSTTPSQPFNFAPSALCKLWTRTCAPGKTFRLLASSTWCGFMWLVCSVFHQEACDMLVSCGHHLVVVIMSIRDCSQIQLSRNTCIILIYFNIQSWSSESLESSNTAIVHQQAPACKAFCASSPNRFLAQSSSCWTSGKTRCSASPNLQAYNSF